MVNGHLDRRSDHTINFLHELLVCAAWLYVDLMLAVCRLYAASRVVCIIWPYVGHKAVRVFDVRKAFSGRILAICKPYLIAHCTYTLRYSYFTQYLKFNCYSLAVRAQRQRITAVITCI